MDNPVTYATLGTQDKHTQQHNTIYYNDEQHGPHIKTRCYRRVEIVSKVFLTKWNHTDKRLKVTNVAVFVYIKFAL
jgi:hypothetical protein